MHTDKHRWYFDKPGSLWEPGMQMDFHSIKALGDMVFECDQKSVLVALPFTET